MTTGEAIRRWRLYRHFTQAALAERSGLSRPNLSAIENGGRDLMLGTLRRLADALEIQPGVLADGGLPADLQAPPLSRESLEKTARALAGEKGALSKREQSLARDFRLLIRRQSKAKDFGKYLPRTSRKEQAAWSRLKSLLTREDFLNLLARIEKARQRQGKTI